MHELRARVLRRLAIDGGCFALCVLLALLGASGFIVLSIGWFGWRTMQCLRADAGLRWIVREKAALHSRIADNPGIWIDQRQWALLRLPD